MGRKIFVCSKFPDIPEKSWCRRKRWRKLANAKPFAYQANVKLASSRASMVVTYYINFFCTRADRHNGIFMSLLRIVAEIKIKKRTPSFGNVALVFLFLSFNIKHDLHLVLVFLLSILNM